MYSSKFAAKFTLFGWVRPYSCLDSLVIYLHMLLRNFWSGIPGKELFMISRSSNMGIRFQIPLLLFTRDVESIISLSSQRLRHGRFYIEARLMEADIVPMPKTILHRLQNITLYFGCQVSREKFSVLWKEENVSVYFGIGLRKLHFYFKH